MSDKKILFTRLLHAYRAVRKSYQTNAETFQISIHNFYHRTLKPMCYGIEFKPKKSNRVEKSDAKSKMGSRRLYTQLIAANIYLFFKPKQKHQSQKILTKNYFFLAQRFSLLRVTTPFYVMASLFGMKETNMAHIFAVESNARAWISNVRLLTQPRINWVCVETQSIMKEKILEK